MCMLDYMSSVCKTISVYSSKRHFYLSLAYIDVLLDQLFGFVCSQLKVQMPIVAYKLLK